MFFLDMMDGTNWDEKKSSLELDLAAALCFPFFFPPPVQLYECKPFDCWFGRGIFYAKYYGNGEWGMAVERKNLNLR